MNKRSSGVSLPRHLLRSVEKPARYVGGEWNSVQKDGSQDIHFAFCFPDVYEIGMSNLALRIFYNLLNRREDTWCERAFAPWVDMEAGMRRLDLLLYSLESRTPLQDFDLVGITVPYELSYTNILNMLDLAGIPIAAANRDENHPLVLAGGPACFNIEPMAAYFDLVVLGEGEKIIHELLDEYKIWKKDGRRDKQKFLRRAARIEGIYVPAFYEAQYKADGTIGSMQPRYADLPSTIRRRVVQDLDSLPAITEDIVPSTSIVHDRIFLEVMRGCPRGCRFCQAGMIYRPQREKSAAGLAAQADALSRDTGCDELGLLSLSTSDYGALDELTEELLARLKPQQTSLSLPSLRLDSFTLELMRKIAQTRRSGLTFAPEAGSQRLRDVINKNIKEDDLLQAMELAFAGGWSGAKLYFMLGLPTETREDVAGIAEMARKIRQLHRELPREKRPRRLELTVSTAFFIPKPFTPFQWVGQADPEQMEEHRMLLGEKLRHSGIKYQWHDLPAARLEAVLARGDRRLAPVIEAAWRRGQTFTSWDDRFDWNIWQECLSEAGLDPDFYSRRQRSREEILPWDHFDIGVSKDFLWREYQKALRGQVTAECRITCSACGASCYEGGVCLEYRNR